ncbi:thioesterase II family protein [Streptomyces genisteinicus]|uniref:Alpha/beta fold hydrolase n=1 Tax=Streptomyces genisteinicus TaxID=2768068 RepID=A0A7H0I1I2_9ACTN|nr:alpha/beta fold hydrolase [Streptomyces genisteinicus]QNP66648.1 alpha/beta fold hydrolase [Streptomyces genisteinicus]
MSPQTPGVVVFPGAGSFGTELRPLLRELEPSASLVRYPGRFGAESGRAAGSFGDAVRSCVRQTTRLQPARPLLVGHSFGAYVAYAAATELERLGTEISALVVVGATAPPLLTVPDAAAHDRSDTEAYLRRIDAGLVEGRSGEWREILLDTVMHDLRLLKEFTASAPAYGRLRCPVFAARGEEDPLTCHGGMAAWAASTTGDCTVEVFPGGHSDLLTSPGFASWLREVRGRRALTG